MKQIDFEHGKITDNILRASIPMLVAEVLSLLYNIVDRIYIARIPDVGTTALGAVGLCFPIITIILAFSNLFGSGGAPLFSIERGRKDTKEASMIMNTSFFLICVCALLLMAVGMIFAKPILLLFGSSENGLIYAYPYLMIYLIGTFPSMVSTGMNPFINAQGYATTGMFSVAIGAVANLILDPVFIFVFGLGIRGAAIGTLTARILEVIVLLVYLFRSAGKKLGLHFSNYFHVDPVLTKDYLKTTAPMLVTNGLWGVNTALQTVILGHMTAAAIAANSVASTLYMLIKSTAVGASSTASVMIGKAVGSGDIPLTKHYSKLLQRLFLCIGVLSGITLFFIRIPILSIYDLQPATKEMANTFLIIMSVICVGMTYQMPTNNGIIRGGGNALFVVKMDLISIWCIVLPLSFFMAFVMHASPTVVVWCLNADQIFKCVPAFLESNYGNWIRKLTRDE